MAKRGIIYVMIAGESKVYALLPWVQGIFDFGAKNRDPPKPPDVYTAPVTPQGDGCR
jgi:hypothetical protein